MASSPFKSSVTSSFGDNNIGTRVSSSVEKLHTWKSSLRNRIKGNPTEEPKHVLQDWTRSRCGPTGSAIWVYQGALYDPLDGKQIAEVEGLELVRCLAESTDDSRENKRRFKRRCGDLAAAAAVSHPDATFDYASTVLSRRLFCYRDPSDPKQLLKEIRLRPGSPARVIPTEQSVAVYDTASTFVSRGGNLLSEWFVHSEFPDAKCLWSRAQSKQQRDNDQSLEFTVYARAKSNKKQQAPDLTAPVVVATTNNNGKAAIASPGRSALIQFGQSSAEKQGRFGARETYHYTTIEAPQLHPAVHWFRKTFKKELETDSCSVRYTRYGEGPPWYGPGRLCTLELTGKRISDSSNALPLAARIAAERVPGFLSVHAPVAEADELAARAVDWFRGKGSEVLQVTPDFDETKPAAWMRRWQRKAGSVAKRVQEASAISIGGNG